MQISLREGTMFPSADHATACGQAALSTEAARRPRKFWFSIVRIAVIEVVVLAALAGVFVAYLNWSSEASFAEFVAVSKMQASPSSAPHAVKASWRCDRNA
jgi:hypothetical protein